MLSFLRGFGAVTLILLIVGVLGSLSIRSFGLLLEPGMRWLVERWQERRDIREFTRSDRLGSMEAEALDAGKSVEEVAHMQVEHDRRYLRNAVRWIADWLPNKRAYARHRKRNFWLEPKWEGKVIGWVAGEVINRVRSSRRTESLQEMRLRLSQDYQLRQLILALEKELESNPSGPFIGDEDSKVLERLDEIVSETEFRLASMPALSILLVSMGIALVALDANFHTAKHACIWLVTVKTGRYAPTGTRMAVRW